MTERFSELTSFR